MYPVTKSRPVGTELDTNICPVIGSQHSMFRLKNELTGIGHQVFFNYELLPLSSISFHYLGKNSPLPYEWPIELRPCSRQRDQLFWPPALSRQLSMKSVELYRGCAHRRFDNSDTYVNLLISVNNYVYLLQPTGPL